MTPDKNLVFTVTHGRTGTTFLTELFKMFDDTLSLHEPEPNYTTVFPSVKQDPRHAIGFLEKKLAYIGSIREKHYVETSNVFGKGFLVPLLRMGVTPGLIMLNRNFRETANSLFQRGSTPMRSDNGRRYSADPRVPGSLPIHKPDQLSDYQLCYWGVLDAFFRQLQADRLYRHEGLNNFCWSTVNDFHDYDHLISTGKMFGMGIGNKDKARAYHQDVIRIHHNPNRKERSDGAVPNYAGEEQEVLDRIAFHDPLFVESALLSGFIEQEVMDGFGVAQQKQT